MKRSVAVAMASLLCLQSAGSAAALGIGKLASFERTASGGWAAEQALAPRLETFFRSEEGLNTPPVLEVRKLLRSGGFTNVYEGFDRRALKTVILKFPSSELDAPEMFRREVHHYSRLKDLRGTAVRARFPEIRETGAWGNSEYVSFNLLPGKPLDKVMEDYPLGMPVLEAADILRQILILLGQLHRKAGLVHEDLMPSNILADKVDGRWRVSILDLGLSMDLIHPMDGMMGGTPGFMPPERIVSFQAAVPSDDLYTAGALFAELLTGSNPNTVIQNQLYDDEWMRETASLLDGTDLLVFSWKQNEMFLKMVGFSSLPDAVKRFITKACASQRANRFQDAREMLEALKVLIASHRGKDRMHTDLGDFEGHRDVSKVMIENLRLASEGLLSLGAPNAEFGLLIHRAFNLAAHFAMSRWHHIDLSGLSIHIAANPTVNALLSYLPQDWWMAILRELLLNAIESMAKSDAMHLTIDISHANGEDRLSISDKGSGMSMNELELLGRPGYSRKSDGFPGTGGGLWSVMRLLEVAGGLRVRSLVGIGTTITVAFDVNLAKAA